MSGTERFAAMHLDCASGLAGDMFLGACLDAGLPRAVLDEVPTRLGLENVSLAVRSSIRGGITGVRFTVLEGGSDLEATMASAGPRPSQHTQVVEDQHTGAPGGGSGHLSHRPLGHHQHRSLSEIRRRIVSSGLAPAVRERAEAMFVRLAEVEAGIHGVDQERVHFHELGAVDSMIDIVGAAAAIEFFSPDQVTCGLIVTGNGTVETDHGLLPIPAPATSELLKGLEFSHTGRSSRQSVILGELLTPTGALILDHLVRVEPRAARLVAHAHGWGLGERELPDRPNAFRLTLGSVTSADANASESSVCVLESAIDDASGERIAAAIEALLSAGALDAYTSPTTMKKGRPGVLVTVLGRPTDEDSLAQCLLAETGSLGCRVRLSRRLVADRHLIEAITPWGSVSVKVGKLAGAVISVAPESDACKEVGLRHGVSWSEVYRVARMAAEELLGQSDEEKPGS